MKNTEPWQICPSFTDERLRLIAAEIVRVRAEALQEFQPEKGDDAWSFGCRAYRWTCHAISTLAKTNQHSWLRVREEGLSFAIIIDNQPIRFYCGEAQRPTPKSLRRGLDELVRQGRFDFMEDELDRLGADWFWLLAIEKQGDGTALRIVILQANPLGNVRNLWEIPTERSASIAASVSSTVRDPVELPPPRINTKQPQRLRAVSNSNETSND